MDMRSETHSMGYGNCLEPQAINRKRKTEKRTYCCKRNSYAARNVYGSYTTSHASTPESNTLSEPAVTRTAILLCGASVNLQPCAFAISIETEPTPRSSMKFP